MLPSRVTLLEGAKRMRSIAIGLLEIALVTSGAVAQTIEEQAQVLRDFHQNVADYTQRHQCLDPAHSAAATPAPRIFTLPVAMVFRQLIAKALDERGHDAAMTAVGRTMPLQHHPAMPGPFPAAKLYAFPEVLLEALPPLPRPLEYRLIGHDLVLRDVEADVIVGVLRDAVGGVTTTIRR